MIAAFSFYVFATILLGAGTGVIFSKNPVHSVLFLILAFFNAAALFVMLGAEFLAMLLVIVYVGAVAVLLLFVVMMLEIEPRKASRLTWEERKSRLKQGIGESLRFKIAFIPLFLALVYGLSSLDLLFNNLGDSHFISNGIPLSLWAIFSSEPAHKSFVTISAGFLIFSFFVSLHVARRLSGVSILDATRHIFSALPMSFFIGILLCLELVFLSFSWSTSSLSQQVITAPIPPGDLTTNTQALAGLIYRYYAYVFQASGLILLVAMIGAIVLSLRQKTTMKRQDVSVQISRDPRETLELTKPGIGEGVSDV